MCFATACQLTRKVRTNTQEDELVAGGLLVFSDGEDLGCHAQAGPSTTWRPDGLRAKHDSIPRVKYGEMNTPTTNNSLGSEEAQNLNIYLR